MLAVRRGGDRYHFHYQIPISSLHADETGRGATGAPAACRRLATGPARVVDLTRELGLAQSTVSGHLACLRDCGLAAVQPQGRASVWSLAQPALLDLLTAAEAVLEATGNAVTLCPAYAGQQ